MLASGMGSQLSRDIACKVHFLKNEKHGKCGGGNRLSRIGKRMSKGVEDFHNIGKNVRCRVGECEGQVLPLLLLVCTADMINGSQQEARPHQLVRVTAQQMKSLDQSDC